MHSKGRHFCSIPLILHFFAASLFQHLRVNYEYTIGCARMKLKILLPPLYGPFYYFKITCVLIRNGQFCVPSDGTSFKVQKKYIFIILAHPITDYPSNKLTQLHATLLFLTSHQKLQKKN